MSIIKNELLKQKKTLFILCILFPLLSNALLYVDLTYRYEAYLLIHQSEYGLSNWQLIFKEQTVFYFSEICHIIAATIVYEIFSIELKYNAWMLVSSSPYRKSKVLFGKYVIAMIAFLLFFVVDYASLIFIVKAIGVQGKLEIALFVKSFCVQFAAASMLIAFYLLFTCLFRRIVYLIPVGCVFMVLNISLYYTENVQFLVQYPTTYISHCFRASVKEAITSIVLSGIFTVSFLVLSKLTLSNNRDIHI